MSETPMSPEASQSPESSAGAQPQPSPSAAATDASGDRTWPMLCHLAALCMFLGVPFGNIVGPLVIWLIKRNEMPAVDVEGKKALNFQITMAIAGIIAGLTFFILIGFLLVPAVVIFDLVCVIIASIKTSNGEKWDYPLSFHFIK